MYKLRDYQNKGIDLIRSRVMAGDKRIILWAMTGAGKGLIMSELNRLNVFRGRKVLNIMRRKELIHQTQRNFKKYHNLDCSIIMGTAKGLNFEQNIQIGSIDTLQRRYKKGKLDVLLNCDTIIIDEMQDTTSNGYRDFLNWINENGTPNKLFIGMSATPFMIGNRSHDWWTSVVKPIEAHELRDKGFLVKDRIYAPKKIDLSKLRKMQGDYHIGDLFEAVSELSVIGDVVNSYKKYGENKPAVLFAVNIKHSIMMVEAFRRAGIPAAHYDKENSSEERQKGILDLKTGEIKVLCNVNIFSTGVDIPWAEVGILARPTMSEVLDLQQRGRLLRPYKICGKCGSEYGGDPTCMKCGSSDLKYEKPYAVFIDHANNADRHGLTYAIRAAALEAKKKEKKKFAIGQEVHIKQCPECFMYSPRSAQNCDGCGYEYKTQERAFKEEDGELVLLDEKLYRAKMSEKVEARWSYHKKQMRYKPVIDMNYAYKKIFEDFGNEVFKFIKFPELLEKEYRKNLILGNASKVFK